MAYRQSGGHRMGCPAQTACAGKPACPACPAGTAGAANPPQRVPIISPSSGVKPIVVSVDRPPATAHMLLPAPVDEHVTGRRQQAGWVCLLGVLA